jgi:hypothetical protein
VKNTTTMGCNARKTKNKPTIGTLHAAGSLHLTDMSRKVTTDLRCTDITDRIIAAGSLRDDQAMPLRFSKTLTPLPVGSELQALWASLKRQHNA